MYSDFLPQECPEDVSEGETVFSEEIDLLNLRKSNTRRNSRGSETSLEIRTPRPTLLLKPSEVARLLPKSRRSRRISSKGETNPKTHQRPTPLTEGQPAFTSSETRNLNYHGPNARNSGDHKHAVHDSPFDSGHGRVLPSDLLSPKILQRNCFAAKQMTTGHLCASNIDSDSSVNNDGNDSSPEPHQGKHSRETPARQTDCTTGKKGKNPNKLTLPPNYYNTPQDLPSYPGYERNQNIYKTSIFGRDPENQIEPPAYCTNTAREFGDEGNELKISKTVQTSSGFDYITLDANPQNKVEENEKELDLKCLGFNNNEIRWEDTRVPERRELHRLIHFRICHYINPDIIIAIDDHEFYCHRIVLQSYSEYFDEFNNLEYNTHIDISGMNVTKAAFIAIYSWMLSLGQGGFHQLTRDNILEVLIACQHLRVKDFENQCLAFIDDKNVFSEENAFFLFLQASKLKQRAIMELMLPRIQAFFLILVCSKNFLELELEDLCIILQSNYIVVHCEQEVFMSAVRWLKHDWTERQKHMRTVINCIRFSLMTPSQLVEIRKNPEIPEFLEISKDPEVQKYIEDGLAYAVEKTLSGSTTEHKQRCKLLGLNVPQPRNWTETTKCYRSYKEFLEFLAQIRPNPRSMYSVPTANNESTLEAILMSTSSNEHLSGSENELNELESREDIPSMTDLLHNEKPKRECPLRSHLRSSNLPAKDKTDYKTEKVDFKNSNKRLIASNLTNSATMKVQNFNKNEVPSQNSSISQDVNLHRSVTTQGSTITNLTSRDNKPRKAETTQNVIVDETKNINYKKPTLRTSAAIIIQTAYRGYRARKMMEAMRTDKRSTGGIKLQEGNNTEKNRHAVNVKNDQLNRPSVENLSTTATVAKGDQGTQREISPKESLYFLNRESILIFGGLDPSRNLNTMNTGTSVFRYNPEDNVWENVGSMPEPRYYHNVSLLNGRIYLAGGSDPLKEEINQVSVSDLMWSFDPNNRTWTEEPRMITGRKNFGLVAFHGYLYAIGGQDKNDKVLASVEKYDPNNRKWSEITPLSVARVGAAVCRYDHKIWVAGGMGNSTRQTILKHVECYDPKRDMWISKTPLRFPRAFAAFFSTNESLYLVGGASKESHYATSTEAIDIWDSINKEWQLKAEMSIPRHGHTICYLSTQMIILGGISTKYLRSLNSVEAWCVNRETWMRGIMNLPEILAGHSSITLPMLSG